MHISPLQVFIVYNLRIENIHEGNNIQEPLKLPFWNISSGKIHIILQLKGPAPPYAVVIGINVKHQILQLSLHPYLKGRKIGDNIWYWVQGVMLLDRPRGFHPPKVPPLYKLLIWIWKFGQGRDYLISQGNHQGVHIFLRYSIIFHIFMDSLRFYSPSIFTDSN